LKLVIFDLDQTLVDFVLLHNEVTHRMLKKHFGVEAWLTEVEHAGRSQRDGMRNLAELKGVPANVFNGKVDRILEDFGAEFAASMPADASNHILAGARELLETLSGTNNVVVLYTGDAPGVVDAVLLATGLGRYFAYRFSGTEVEKREDMVALAMQEAEAATGRQFKEKDVVIIGDSIRDVECGLKFNALVIGVATGYYSAPELVRAGADFAVRSLRECKTILDAITKAG
jgi:phosphoglycolate phosphatase-like HAD superfamily hydrolase